MLVKEGERGVRVRWVSGGELAGLYGRRTTLERFAMEEAWEERTDADVDVLKRRLGLLEQARTAKNVSTAIDGEIAFHSWIYELSGHGLLKSHWQKLVPLVRIYMSIHNRQHGVTGVFMDANHKYVDLMQGDDRAAILNHIGEHMQKGLDSVYASVEADR